MKLYIYLKSRYRWFNRKYRKLIIEWFEFKKLLGINFAKSIRL